MSNFEKVPVGILNKVENNKQIFIAEFKDKLQEVFPSAVKDGIVDFEALLNEFGKYAETDEKEKYNMTWVGKKEAIKTANEDIIGKTLKYVSEDSKDPETTQNLYIEGDNLEVLKLLRNSYYGKIKMIYIDPPYNTGNDFIYKDNFKMDKEEYEKLEGSIDEYNERLTASKKGSGRYHSDWMSMMYPRLKVARDLLKDDGVIFISIDDNELINMKKICDEIYGEKNFISNFIWIKKKKGSHLSKTIRNMTEYVLAYTANIENIELFGEAAYSDKWQPLAKRTNSHKNLKFNPNILETKLEDGYYKKGNYGEGTSSINFENDFEVKNNIIITEVNAKGPFIWTQTKLDQELKLGTRVALSSKFGFNVFRSNQSDKIKRPTTLLDGKLGIGTNEDAYSEGIKIFGKENIMSYPKPTSLLKYLINTIGYYDKNMTILDFFSGSATTAHATMQLNAEDGGNRKFIMVQIPELLNLKIENNEEKFKTICDIGRKRIDLAGEKIKEENKDKEGIENLDIGFKVFKVSDTNIRWISDAIKSSDGIEEKDIITQEELRENESYKDRLDFNPWFTDLDVVYEMMLKRQDIELTERIEKLSYIGDRTYLVGYTILVCLEENITKEMVRKISEIETSLSWIVFRDSAFEDDINLKTNTINLLRTLIKEKNPRNKNQKILWI
ncbi:site-specific DNA-methyltransferase [Clostridium perfringens]